MINVPELLKSTQWQAGPDSTIRDIDIRGVGLSVVADRLRRSSFRGKIGGTLQQVIEYADVNQAKEQYSFLAGFEFQDSFSGQPPQGLIFTFKDIEGVAALNLRADKYRITCMDIYDPGNPAKVQEVHCVGLLLYANYLVLFETWASQNYPSYLSSDDLMTLFKAVDEKMAIALRSLGESSK